MPPAPGLRRQTRRAGAMAARLRRRPGEPTHAAGSQAPEPAATAKSRMGQNKKLYEQIQTAATDSQQSTAVCMPHVGVHNALRMRH